MRVDLGTRAGGNFDRHSAIPMSTKRIACFSAWLLTKSAFWNRPC
jgi:hypothetical protein